MTGAFLAADAPRVPHGGWLPLVLGAMILALTTTGRRGRKAVIERLAEVLMPPLRPTPQVRLDP